MLREALEQSGIAGLVGWNKSDDEDNILHRAWVRNSLKHEQKMLTVTGSSNIPIPISDLSHCNQDVSNCLPLPFHLLHSPQHIDKCIWPLLLQLYSSDRF